MVDSGADLPLALPPPSPCETFPGLAQVGRQAGWVGGGWRNPLCHAFCCLLSHMHTPAYLCTFFFLPCPAERTQTGRDSACPLLVDGRQPYCFPFALVCVAFPSHVPCFLCDLPFFFSFLSSPSSPGTWDLVRHGNWDIVRHTVGGTWIVHLCPQHCSPAAFPPLPSFFVLVPVTCWHALRPISNSPAISLLPFTPCLGLIWTWPVMPWCGVG